LGTGFGALGGVGLGAGGFTKSTNLGGKKKGYSVFSGGIMEISSVTP
jgi:hypothetical protein